MPDLTMSIDLATPIDLSVPPDLVTPRDLTPPPDLLKPPDLMPPPPDLACTQSVCVDPAPSGWTGPVELYEGPPSGAPSCGGSYPIQRYTGNAGLGFSSGTCSACQVAGSPQVVCEAALDMYGGSGCGSGPGGCYGLTAYSNSCSSSTWCNPAASLNPSGRNNTALCQGGCTITAQATNNRPPISWSTATVACGFSTLTGGCNCPCSGGKVCAMLPGSPFTGSKLCVLQAGDIACPMVTYTEKHLAYGGVMDTRGCTQCYGGCSSNSCTATYAGYASGDCSGGPSWTVSYAPNGGSSCMNIGSTSSVQLINVTFSPAPACIATGGAVTGTVTVDQPTTICCTP